MVSPKVRYHPPNSQHSIPGVSINLKDFLSECDRCHITHPSEKIIRRKVRHTRYAISSTHQRFLTNQYPATPDVSTIPRSCFTDDKACITLPREQIPEVFFEHLNEGMYISLILHAYTYFVKVTTDCMQH